MRVASGTSVTVHGDGFKEWEATIPTQEGATAADVLKELENAVSFELRSLDLMKQTVVVPNSALWRDISTHLTHGYYLFAHVHAVTFFWRLDGKAKKTRIKPCLTIQDFIEKSCPAGTMVDGEINKASNKAQSKSWLMKRLHSVKSFRSLSFGGLARAEDEADELARAANS